MISRLRTLISPMEAGDLRERGGERGLCVRMCVRVSATLVCVCVCVRVCVCVQVVT